MEPERNQTTADQLPSSADHRAGRPFWSRKERTFYAQFTESDWAYRKKRRAQAHRQDQELGRWINAQWELLSLARRQLRLTAQRYQQQRTRVLDCRIHVRRCRHGCVACPHTVVTFSKDGAELHLPMQTRVLRQHGVLALASAFRAAQKEVDRLESTLKTLYRDIRSFEAKSIDILVAMDRELTEIAYPYYPTPFIPPNPSGPYTPLPYAAMTRFSEWVDDAQKSIAFALLRYATMFVKTRFGRAKQGFYGITFNQRVNLFSPLYSQWRVYFRGHHGIWFSASRIKRQYRTSQGKGEQNIRVSLTRKFAARSGNRAYFYDVTRYREMYESLDLRHCAYVRVLDTFRKRLPDRGRS